MKTFTMKQIAKELNLNRMTVSAVINNVSKERRISEATTQRVREYLNKRGFVPSRQALNLKQGKRDLVGILFYSPSYTHLIEAFNRLTNIYNSKPNSLEMLVVSYSQTMWGIKELLARGVSKLIWIHSRVAHSQFLDHDIFNYLTNFEKVVFYNYVYRPNDNSADLIKRGFYLVGLDRLQGFRQMAQFLKSLGHTKVIIPDTDEKIQGKFW